MKNGEIELLLLLHIIRNGDCENRMDIEVKFSNDKIIKLIDNELIEPYYDIGIEWLILTNKGQSLIDTYTQNLNFILGNY